ncbi:hypothetical protein PR048_018346 [Dryococelus australis]|uniref:Uncharacterized protein n=1 Tax=Dryococelus australis TaxID=614101 RepID=A0ABQ9HC89_9NEOP|nr:hypothetical protein PR048_018346 [Dryococelus australis]
MKGLIYHTSVESEEELLARIMAAADLGLLGIGDRVYQKMVRRYRVCVDVAGRHSEPFLRGRGQHVMWWCFVYCGETVREPAWNLPRRIGRVQLPSLVHEIWPYKAGNAMTGATLAPIHRPPWRTLNKLLRNLVSCNICTRRCRSCLPAPRAVLVTHAGAQSLLGQQPANCPPRSGRMRKRDGTGVPRENPLATSKVHHVTDMRNTSSGIERGLDICRGLAEEERPGNFSTAESCSNVGSGLEELVLCPNAPLNIQHVVMNPDERQPSGQRRLLMEFDEIVPACVARAAGRPASLRSAVLPRAGGEDRKMRRDVPLPRVGRLTCASSSTFFTAPSCHTTPRGVTGPRVHMSTARPPSHGPIPVISENYKNRNLDGRTGKRTRVLPSASTVRYHSATSLDGGSPSPGPSSDIALRRGKRYNRKFLIILSSHRLLQQGVGPVGVEGGSDVSQVGVASQFSPCPTSPQCSRDLRAPSRTVAFTLRVSRPLVHSHHKYLVRHRLTISRRRPSSTRHSITTLS